MPQDTDRKKRAKKKNLHLFEFLPVASIIGLMFVELDTAIAVLWCFLLLFLIIVLNMRANKYLRMILMIGFIVRVLFIFADDKLSLVNYAWDDYHSVAIAIKQNIIDGIPIFSGIYLPLVFKTFSLFSSFFYLLFGDIALIIRITNAFFAILIVERVYRICIEIFENQNIALKACLLVAFFPSFIIFTSLYLRDSLVFFLSVDLLYRVIILLKLRRRSSVIFLIGDMVLIFFLRPQNIPLYLSIFTIYTIFSYFIKSSLPKKTLIIFLLTSTILFLFDRLEVTRDLLVNINQIMISRTEGGSAYLPDIQYATWLDIIKYLPIRFFYFTFGPAPWDIDNSFMLLSFIESMFLLFFFVFFLRYSMNKVNFHNRYKLLLLVFSLTGLVANSLMDSNYGTAIRHKMNYVFVFMIFGSAYLAQYRIKITGMTLKRH